MLLHRLIIGLLCITLSSLAQSQEILDVPNAEEEDNSVESMLIEAKKLTIIGRPDKAETILLKAYNQDRTNPTIAFELAKAYYEKKDYIAGEKYMQAALKIRPNDAWMLEYYISQVVLLPYNPQNIPYFDAYLTSKPKSLPAYDKYINYYLGAKLYKEAQSIADKMIAANGENEETLKRKLEVCDALSCGDKEMILQKLVASNQEEKSYLKLLAKHYISKNKTKETEQTYAKVLSIDPNDTEANVANMKTAKTEQVATSSYLKTLYPLVKNETIPIEAKVLELKPYLENLMARTDTNYAGELRELGSLLSLTHPKEGLAQAFYADVLYASNQYKGAALQYQKTLKINNRNFETWQNLLSVLELSNDLAAMETTAAQAVDLFPNKVDAYIVYAKSLIMNNKKAEAKDIITEANLVAGNNPKYKNTLAILSIKNENGTVTLSDLEERAKSDPKLYELLGDIELKKGNIAKTTEYWRLALKAGANIQEKAFMCGIKL